MTIHEELLNCAVTSKPKFDGFSASESDNEYLGRLTAAISNATRTQFDAMSEEAQLWFDAAADAMNSGIDIPVPDGFKLPQPEPVRITRPGNGKIMRPGARQVEREAPLPEPEKPAKPAKAAKPEKVVKPAKPEKVAKPAKIAKPAAPEPEPAPKPKVPAAPRPLTDKARASRRVRELLLSDQNLSIDDLMDTLKVEKLTAAQRGTVSTLRYDTLATITVAKDLGWGPTGAH